MTKKGSSTRVKLLNARTLACGCRHNYKTTLQVVRSGHAADVSTVPVKCPTCRQVAKTPISGLRAG